jgi:uncharacterized Ntn-hydrolase superfamily protein
MMKKGLMAEATLEALIKDDPGRETRQVGLVDRQSGGYDGNNDRYLDLRVDNYPEPIQKLRELLKLHHLFFDRTEAQKLVPLAGIAAKLQDLLRRSGHYQGGPTGVFDETTRKALRELVGMENLEERWNG